MDFGSVLDITVSEIILFCCLPIIGVFIFAIFVDADTTFKKQFWQILLTGGVFYCLIELFRIIQSRSINDIFSEIQNKSIPDLVETAFSNIFFSTCLSLVFLLFLFERSKINSVRGEARWLAERPLYNQIERMQHNMHEARDEFGRIVDFTQLELKYGEKCGQLEDYAGLEAFTLRLNSASYDDLKFYAEMLDAKKARSKKDLISNILNSEMIKEIYSEEE